MKQQPKSPIFRSKLFKQLQSIATHCYSDIRNLHSTSSSTKISVKSFRSVNNQPKNTHFNGSLFEEAYRINPAIQSYLPKCIQSISNKQKTKNLLLHKQKQLRSFKSHRILKSLSINRGDSARRQQILKNEIQKQKVSKEVASMSSLTFLIMNGCEYAEEESIKKDKMNKTKPLTSTEYSAKQLKSTPSKQSQSKYDNPYGLLSSRRIEGRQKQRR